ILFLFIDVLKALSLVGNIMQTDFEHGLVLGACLEHCTFHNVTSLHDLEVRVWPQLNERFDVSLGVFRTAASKALQELQGNFVVLDNDECALLLSRDRASSS